MNTPQKIAVVGAGVAGLVFSLELLRLRESSVRLTVFADAPKNNSAYAQGGLAVSSPDIEAISRHKADTFLAGEFANDVHVVDRVVSGSASALQTLLDYGVVFDENERALNFHQEGGHCEARIVHRADATGSELVRTLGRKLQTYASVRHVSKTLVTSIEKRDCVPTESPVFVVTYIDSNCEMYSEEFDIVYLCTGGVGGVFARTTNAETAVGSGLTLAKNLGATLRDLEFIQFHPTAMVAPKSGRMQLATEALRGAGSILVDEHRRRLRAGDGQYVEMLTRDKLARLVWKHTTLENGGVYLDSSNMPPELLQQQFPQFWKACEAWHKNPSRDPIQVDVAAHYSCGGVAVDSAGNSGIKHLYVGGELMSTGLHGANRLASNSLTEAVVYAKASASDVSRQIRQSTKVLQPAVFIATTKSSNRDLSKIREALHSLRKCMSLNLGVVQSAKQYIKAAEVIQQLAITTENNRMQSKEWFVLQFAVQTAKLILSHSTARSSNIGTFFNSDLA